MCRRNNSRRSSVRTSSMLLRRCIFIMCDPAGLRRPSFSIGSIENGYPGSWPNRSPDPKGVSGSAHTNHKGTPNQILDFWLSPSAFRLLLLDLLPATATP
ncbi:hypothetical protein EJB05_11978, partial [Eragrostis curvula]